MSAKSNYTSTRKPPAPPDGLSDRGRCYWSDVVGRFELAIPAETTLLHELCRALGVLDTLAGILANTPSLQQYGSQKQPVAHWALAELRATRSQVVALTKALDLPTEDEGAEDEAKPPIPAATSERARKAANARWARERGAAGSDR